MFTAREAGRPAGKGRPGVRASSGQDAQGSGSMCPHMRTAVREADCSFLIEGSRKTTRGTRA